MPIYDYHCSDCDIEFTELRPMARCTEPAACPRCRGGAQRFITAPRLATLRPEARLAHQTNERSAHEPRVSRAHQCGAGCAHHSDKPSQLRQSGTSKRPWMIGH